MPLNARGGQRPERAFKIQAQRQQFAIAAGGSVEF
jgi:hypothetical protein